MIARSPRRTAAPRPPAPPAPTPADQSQPRRIRRRSRHRQRDSRRRLRRHHHLGLRPLRRQHRHPDLGGVCGSSGFASGRRRLWSGAPGRGRRAAGRTPSAGDAQHPDSSSRPGRAPGPGRGSLRRRRDRIGARRAQQRPPGLHARPRRLGLPTPRPAAAGSSTGTREDPGSGNPAHPGPAQDPDGSGPDGCGGPDGPEGRAAPAVRGTPPPHPAPTRMKPRTRRARLHHRHLRQGRSQLRAGAKPINPAPPAQRRLRPLRLHPAPATREEGRRRRNPPPRASATASQHRA